MSSNGPVYSLNGNRIGSDGSTAAGGNAVTPPPTQNPYTPPLVSSESGSSSNLISVLSEQNEILRAGFSSLSASSSLNSSTPYIPSSTSSVPPNAPLVLREALEESGQSGFLGKAFRAIGDIIQYVIDLVYKFTDAIGLTNSPVNL